MFLQYLSSLDGLELAENGSGGDGLGQVTTVYSLSFMDLEIGLVYDNIQIGVW